MPWQLLALVVGALSGTLPPVALENFERPRVATLGPGGFGATQWPAWGRPTGTAAARVWLDLQAERGGRNHFGRLRCDQADGYCLLPVPPHQLLGRPTALSLRVRGDGQAFVLGATLTDALGQWLALEPLTLNHQGWRTVSLDLGRFAERAPSLPAPQPPYSLLSLNLRWAAPTSGELGFDDLSLAQTPWRDLDLLSVRLTGCAPARLCLPEDPAPALEFENRARSTQVLHLQGTLGTAPIAADLTVQVDDRAQFKLKLTDSGPQTLDLVIGSAEGQLPFRRELACLPRRAVATDRLLGLGDYTLDDVFNGRFARDLPDLRAAGATWTRLRLERAIADEVLLPADWKTLDDSLSTAWALGVRVVAGLPAAAYESAESAGVSREVALHCANDIAAWHVRPRTGSRAEQYDAALAAAKARAGDRPLLAELASASPAALEKLAAGVFCLPVGLSRKPPGGPFPRALRLLADRLGGGSGPPVWLYGRGWPVEDVTGLSDPVAGAAVLLSCARALNQVEAFGWGAWRDDESGFGLNGARGECRESFLAVAVNARLLGGLTPAGVEQPQPELYVLSFGGTHLTARVLWSEGGARTLKVPVDAELYDLLGRRLDAKGELALGARPVYWLTRTPGA